MTLRRLACWIAVFGLTLASPLMAGAVETRPLEVRLFEDGAGQRYFAASLGSLESANANLTAPASVVVVVDTSASQTGLYRETAIAAAEACLASLAPTDQVQLVAADLNARPLTDTAVAPDSEAMQAAIERLRNEAPLGSTDLAGALKAAADLATQAGTSRHALIYIGDGVSSAGSTSLVSQGLVPLIGQLREAQVAVSSYAIGPSRNAALLAAIANQTGGNLYVDEPMVFAGGEQGLSVARATQENKSRGARIGRLLADWAQADVRWPISLSSSEGVIGVYPTNLPPLRSDRDSVLIGRVEDSAKSVSISIDFADGTTVWNAELAEPNETHAYLVDLVDSAARDGGVHLTALGTAGLEETGRLLLVKIEQLTDLAERAASVGDAAGAEKISQAILRRDPGNLRAQTVQRFARERKSVPAKGIAHTEKEGLSPIRTAQLEILEQAPAPQATPPQPPIASGYQDEGFYPPSEVVVDGRFLGAVERNNRVFEQMLEKEVHNAVADARDLMAENPAAAIQDLKQMLRSVETTTELVSSVRAGLLDRLRSALREASRLAIIKDDVDRQRLEALATAREHRALLDHLELEHERTAQMIARFNALVDERQYALASEVAAIALEETPDGVAPRVAQIWGEQKHYYELNRELRSQRASGFINALAQVEKSFIPFPDDPPIVYPDPEFWAELTERRKKYASVDLAGQSESEEAIAAALSSPLSSLGLEFQDSPLEEVVAFLRDEYDIEIQLDTTGLDDLGIGPDEPVTVNLHNSSLRSALRFMLRPLELTYVIDNEMLLITSEDEALTRLSVKVYPVADLVLPIINQPAGGIGGGGGGLGGGGGGGLGGGGGGGGGGFGGGGQGGGGGGQFSVPDQPETTLTLTRATNPSLTTTVPNASAEATGKPSSQTLNNESDADRLQLPAKDASVSHWEAVFTDTTPNPRAVRHAVRRLMADRRFDHVAALIEAALRHGQPQSWMYESLGIAMQLDGRDKADVERVFMSAVDFAQSPEQLLAIADFLTGLDFDKRAVQVCRLAVEQAPQLQEAYALALRAAKRSGDVDSLRWATVAILSQAWPTDQSEIAEAARRAGESLTVQLEADGLAEEAAALREELASARIRDCRIRVTWTGEADVDLAVEEPGGSVCWLGQPRTTGGGVSLGDAHGVAQEGKPLVHSEIYELPRGFSGDYRLAVRKIWGDVTADTVTVEVTLGDGDKNEETVRRQIRLEGNKDAVVEFTLSEGRRDEPIEEQQLAQAISRQQAISQAVLTQQLSSLAGDNPTSLRPGELRRRRRALAQAGSGVGFQPVIITLPDGTNFQATAVVSADRRYVRVSPVPFFSGVTSVSSFSFTGAGAGGGNNGGNTDGRTARGTFGDGANNNSGGR